MLKPDLRHIWGIFALTLLLQSSFLGCEGPKLLLGDKLASTVQTMAVTWKIDRLGCDGNRSDETANEIADAIQLQKNVHMDQIEPLLGKFEFSHMRNDVQVKGYYYDGDCVKGELPDGAVYCVLEFFFNADGILLEASTVCG